jgi:MFS family permease
MAGHPERWSCPFTQVEMRRLWTYSDGALTAKGYQVPGGTAGARSWVLVEQATGNVQGVVPPGEFSRRFRPVDLFADVPGLPTYLGTVTAPDGTALVDLVLDRNPFMLANRPRRVARPHALIVPRSRRRILIFRLTLFSAASLLAASRRTECGSWPRAAQGAGAALIAPAALAMIVTNFPRGPATEPGH